MDKTEGLTKNCEIEITGVDGATGHDANHAMATDFLRRVKAGEIVSLYIRATDINGNDLEYRPNEEEA